MPTVTAVGTKINTQKIQYRNNSNAFVLVFTEHYRLLEKEKEAGASPGTSQNALDHVGLESAQRTLELDLHPHDPPQEGGHQKPVKGHPALLRHRKSQSCLKGLRLFL